MVVVLLFTWFCELSPYAHNVPSAFTAVLW